MPEEGRKVVFLDRDGTINVDHGYVHTLEQWEWCDGAIKGLQKLKDAGYALTVITNQSGIGHDLYPEEDMHAVHRYMMEELDKEDATIEALAFCAERQDVEEPKCRKPAIGMAKEIEKKIGPINYANSWTVGDKEADVAFGKNSGTKTVLIRSKYWVESELDVKPDAIVDSLLEAAQHITAS